MANGLIDAVSNERIEAAVDRTLRLHAQQGGALLNLNGCRRDVLHVRSGGGRRGRVPPVRDSTRPSLPTCYSSPRGASVSRRKQDPRNPARRHELRMARPVPVQPERTRHEGLVDPDRRC